MRELLKLQKGSRESIVDICPLQTSQTQPVGLMHEIPAMWVLINEISLAWYTYIVHTSSCIHDPCVQWNLFLAAVAAVCGSDSVRRVKTEEWGRRRLMNGGRWCVNLLNYHHLLVCCYWTSHQYHGTINTHNINLSPIFLHTMLFSFDLSRFQI